MVGKARTITWDVTENGCHEVTSHHRDKQGYTRIKKDGKTYLTHRVAYAEHLGRPIGKDLVVRHFCDNPSCINPLHLVEGTNQDNMNDRSERNRQAKGRTSGRSKITENDAKMIKYFYEGWHHKDIAELYPVTKHQIHLIRSGKSWAHI